MQKFYRNAKGEFCTRRVWFSENQGTTYFPMPDGGYQKAEDVLRTMLADQNTFLSLVETAIYSALMLSGKKAHSIEFEVCADGRVFVTCPQFRNYEYNKMNANEVLAVLRQAIDAVVAKQKIDAKNAAAMSVEVPA